MEQTESSHPNTTDAEPITGLTDPKKAAAIYLEKHGILRLFEVSTRELVMQTAATDI